MRLLGVELTRLRWRRAVVVLVAVSVLLPMLIWAGMAWSTRPVSDAELRRAEQQVEQEKEVMKGQLEECPEFPQNWDIDPDSPDVAEQCAMSVGEPQVEWYLTRTPLSVGDVLDTGSGVAAVLLGLALIMGATYVGADWSSGSMSNQLLFEPRRHRIWLAKAAAIVVAGVVASVLGQAVFWALTATTTAARDITLTGSQWTDVVQLGLRSVALAGAAGLGGYAVTMLLRSTVGTLGLMLAVSIGGSMLIAALPIEGNGRWLLHNNVLGIVQNGYPYYDYSAQDCFDYMGGEGCQPELSLAEGVRYLGLLILAGAALSVASFQRRDVP
jgi:hypothetical protein